MYDDFFAPPRRTTSVKHQVDTASKSGKVRFHEEVRVRNIRAKGKNLPLYKMDDDDDDDDEEEDDEEEDDDDDDDDESEPDSAFQSQRNFDDEDRFEVDSEGSELSNENDENGFDNSRETIERLKDDLFADENVNTDTNGEAIDFDRVMCMFASNILLQIFRHMKRE